MESITIIPIKSKKIIEPTDDLVNVLLESVNECGLTLQNNDIIVIASKVVSVIEGQIVRFSDVVPSPLAKELAKKAKIPPEFAQVILDECKGRYIGVVPGAITTITEQGLLANAGADQSNVKDNQIIILPRDSKKSAKSIHEQILQKTNQYTGVIIADSRTMPMHLGTVGYALGTHGFEPVLDVRGKKDLFGRPMHITTRAIADQLATSAELLMGESNERIPFVIIRNYNIKKIGDSEEVDINSLIPAERCMFIGPLLPYIANISEKEVK